MLRISVLLPCLAALITPFILGHGIDGAHDHESSVDASDKENVLGHNGLSYHVDLEWAKADPSVAPVINSHAIAEGRNGLLYLVTDHPKAAFLVFKKDDTYVRSFGEGLVGGHGIEIFEKDGEEYNIHVDCGWHFEAEGWSAHPSNGRVTILKTDGTIVKRLPTPYEMGIGEAGERQFMPCDVAVTPTGTILIADGYASDFIYEVTMDGVLVRRWGGPKEGYPSHLKNAHGISLDLSGDIPLVWVPSRAENKIKAFTLEGEYVETIELPGAFAGQLFFKDDKIYTAVCWSKQKGVGKRLPQSGFLVILDRNTKRVLSAPGGGMSRSKSGERYSRFIKQARLLSTDTISMLIATEPSTWVNGTQIVAIRLNYHLRDRFIARALLKRSSNRTISDKSFSLQLVAFYQNIPKNGVNQGIEGYSQSSLSPIPWI